MFSTFQLDHHHINVIMKEVFILVVRERTKISIELDLVITSVIIDGVNIKEMESELVIIYLLRG